MTDKKISADAIKNILLNFSQEVDKNRLEEMYQMVPELLLTYYETKFDYNAEGLSRTLNDNARAIYLHILNKKEGSINDELVKFYELYSFINHHIRSILTVKEARIELRGKQVWVMENLETFLKDGVEIVPDYEQEHTAHLPKNILNNTKDIYTFFKSLCQLYYGNPKDYLVIYDRLTSV